MTRYARYTLVQGTLTQPNQQGDWPLFRAIARLRSRQWLVPLFLALVSALALIPRPAYAADPSFAQAVPIGNDKYTQSMAVGDLNGDGWLDIVQGNAGQSYVYLNDGHGHFPTIGAQLGNDKTNTQSVAVGDLNGDGWLDIVQGDNGQSYVYLNDGHGHFPTIGSQLGNGENTQSVAVGDLNGDGWLDIVQGNADGNQGKSYVYLNDGQGHFLVSDRRALGDGANTRSVAVGDLNGDGWLDIVQGNSSAGFFGNPSQSYVYLNDGQGHFPVSARRALGNVEFTQSVAVGDLNGDGWLDIVQGNAGLSYVYLNDGQGHFPLSGSPLGNGEYTQSVAVGDLNGDGALDIVQGNSLATLKSSAPSPSYVYLNDGEGHFPTVGIQLGNGERTTSVMVGDLNGDSTLDIVQGNSADRFGNPGPSYVYWNDGKGAFTQSVNLGQPADTRSVVVGDLNGDGWLDIIQGNFSDPTMRGGPSYIFLNDRQGAFTQSVNLGPVADTRSVAVGDLNGDGWLDIVQGNSIRVSPSYPPSSVYLNEGHGQFPALGHTLGERADTLSVAVGDLNADGALDIVLGNSGPSYLYLNDGQGGFTQTVPFGHGERTQSVVVGDLNADGALDIIQGNYLQQSYVYLNDGRGSFTQGIPLGNSERTVCQAVGDFNGDGALDIVQGNDGLSYLYLNDGRGGFSQGIPLGNNATTVSIVAGDLNGDGWLDIVQGNYQQQSYVYLNDRRGGFSPGIPLNGEIKTTASVAVGDLNGDGTLDIIQGNTYNYPYDFGKQSYIYPNALRQVTRLPNQGPQITVTRPSPTGNADFFSTPTVLNGPTLPITYTLFDQEGDRVGWVAAAYSLDGGGKWLPAVATKDTITQNLSTGRAIASALTISSPIPAAGAPLQAKLTVTPSVALADVEVWLTITHPNNANLAITLQSPQGTQVPLVAAGQAQGQNFQGTRFSALVTTTIQSGVAPYTGTYQAADLAKLKGETSNGVWTLVINNAGPSTGVLASWGLRLKSPPAPHVFNWDTLASGFFGQSDNVVLRLVAYNQPLSTTLPITGVYHYINSAASSNQWPYVSATTFPFRVRGTQVRVVNETNQPLAGASVYRLPAGQSLGAQPMVDLADQAFHTDAHGYLSGRGVLHVGDQLVALLPMTPTQTTTFTHQFKNYLISATPVITGLALTKISDLGVITLTVPTAPANSHPLLLFNLTVALEWDARNDQLFLHQLETNLQLTSRILYDLTNGQAALGDVTVYHNQQHWRDANIRIFATNQLRPHASIGGIVDGIQIETVAKIVNGATTTGTLLYARGQVEIGAIWNRYGEASDNLGEDWSRALAHELGHYLFFLNDNYLGLDGNRVIAVDSCPGMMSNPYLDQESEFHPQQDWLPNCAATFSNQLLGRSDWETLLHYYPWLHAPSQASNDSQDDGPTILPLAVTQIHFADIITAPTTLVEPTFFLTKADGSHYAPSSGAHALLFQGDQLVDLGAPRNDRIKARGAHPGDELCVYDLTAQPDPLSACQKVQQSGEQLVLAAQSGWQPDTTITPVTSHTITIVVTGVTADALAVRLYPEDAPALPAVNLSYNSATQTFTGSITLAKRTLAAALHFYDPSNPARGLLTNYILGSGSALVLRDGETLRMSSGLTFVLHDGTTLQLSEGDTLEMTEAGLTLRMSSGPIQLNEGDTLRFTDGQTLRISSGSTLRMSSSPRTYVLREGNAPITSSDGQVTLFDEQAGLAPGEYYILQPATVLPATPTWATPVGQAYRLTASPGAHDLHGASITFNYLGRDVAADHEKLLRIYFWDGQQWQPLTTSVDEQHNTAYATAQGLGIYALMYSIDMPLAGPGWNQFGYSIADSRPITAALASIAGWYNLVYNYDATIPNPLQRWKLYAAPPAPAWVNTLQTLVYNQAYWINITATHSVTLQLADVSAAQVKLPTPPALYYGSVQPSQTFTPTAGMPVRAWIDNTLCGEGVTTMEQQQVVYAILVYAAGSAGAVNCGAAGQTIRFQLGAGTVTDMVTQATWDNTQLWSLPLNPPGQNLLYFPIMHR